MKEINPVEVDFLINKDNLYLLGKPHERIFMEGDFITVNDLYAMKKKIWKIIEKSTKLTVFICAEINAKNQVSNIIFTLNDYDADDTRHFSYGPAALYYSQDRLIEEMWYLNGREHRVEGPAIINYELDGSIELEEWWLEGKKVE